VNAVLFGMSNSSTSSLVFERYASDSIDLSDLYNECLTSPSQQAQGIRSRALLIQQRWEPFEAVANAVSRPFGVETLAEDLTAYKQNTFKLIGGYLNGILGGYILLKSVFPNVESDLELSEEGINSLPPQQVTAGQRIKFFLGIVGDNFNNASPRDDDRDKLRFLKALDYNFYSAERSLRPDEKSPLEPAIYDDIDQPMQVRTALGVPFNTAPVDGTPSFKATSARRGKLEFNAAANAAASNAVAILSATPGKKLILVHITRAVAHLSNAGGNPVLTFGGQAPNTYYGVEYEDTNSVHHYWATLTTPAAGGNITLSINSKDANAHNYHIHLVSINKDVGDVVGAEPVSMVDAVNAGRSVYISKIFGRPDVSSVLQLLIRRDLQATARGRIVLRDILRQIWVNAVVASGYGAVPALIGALNNLSVPMPYSVNFWAGDPLSIAVPLTAAGLDFTAPWVVDAYASMYRAFYFYIVDIVNAGGVDLTLRSVA